MFSKRLYNLFILSFAFMLVFTAFQTTGLIAKTVLYSTKTNISSYISLGILYGTFAIFNWISPSTIALIGPRISMIIGATTYLVYVATYFYPIAWVIYFASAIVGAGAGIIWTAQGYYLTMNAGKEHMSAYSGIFWAIFQCSLLVGNIYIYFSFYGKTTIDEATRITTFVVLCAVCGVGVIFFFLLRPAARDDGVVLSDKPSKKPIQALKNALRLFITKEMILFSITFVYTGIELSFWSGVYCAAIGAMITINNSKSLVGLSGIFIGIGEILGGLTFGILGKYVVRKGRGPIVVVALFIHLSAFLLIFLNLPNAASFGDTKDQSFITPNPYVAIFCSFLLGLADAMYNTQIYAAIGIIFQEESVSGFAIFKFTQSVGAAAAFFYSGFVGLHYQLLILVITAVAGTVTFIMAEMLVKRKEDQKSSD